MKIRVGFLEAIIENQYSISNSPDGSGNQKTTLFFAWFFIVTDSRKYIYKYA
jgi:hypothetical protein